MGVQDYGHLTWLHNLAMQVRESFSGRELTNIIVRYVDERPRVVEIHYIEGRDMGKIVVAEIYMHKGQLEDGSMFVECRKTVRALSNPVRRVQVYSKLQSFEVGEMPWVLEDARVH
jgi:hypothetical protein